MIHTRHMKQTAVYWQRTGHDGSEPTFADAEDKSVRWVDKSEVYKDEFGVEKMSAAVLLTDFLPALEDFFLLGEAGDLDSDAVDNPKEADEAYKVKKVTKVPNLRGNDYLIKVWL